MHEWLPLAAESARWDGQRGSDFSVGTHLTEERLVGPGKNPLEFPISVPINPVQLAVYGRILR
jgi:hypothetical protein